ncbi:RecQ family ATP-dependent DNA helicase [Akkermansiaceae bacterium]|nr:RecQ family ATP-dependent DNA helicase [Akkermansiaceae bacterium]
MSASLEPKQSPKEVLLSVFNHTSFLEGQEETIESVLSGFSTLSIFPTGAGKSLCYQLPAVMLEGKTSIVVSPLISLIRDQLQQLEKLGIAATTINSSQTLEEKEEAIQLVSEGKITILFLSPEALQKKDYQVLLKELNIGIVAVDEAHCVSEWGNSFRPSYLLAAGAIRKLKPLAVIALTATATKEVARDIRSNFKIKTKHQFQTSFFRPNLHYKVIPCQSEQRNYLLNDLVNDAANLPAIVYVMRQIDAESVCGFLQTKGVNSRSYHAGMHSDARKLVQDEFIANKVQVVVATIAFGMGVNKPDIRSVIHYHLPKSPEGWVQESGRAGRDGEVSSCYLMACGDDLIPLTNFIQGHFISKSAVTRIINCITSQGKSIAISKYQLCQLNDAPEAQLDIILSKLIMDGYLTPAGESRKYIQVSRLRYTIHEYPKSKMTLAKNIFSHSGRIDTEKSEELFKTSTNKLLAFIQEMEDHGDITTKATGLMHHFTVKKEITDKDALIAQLLEGFQANKKNEIDRLETIIAAATSRSCIPAKLLKYFGDNIKITCGHCSSCLGEKRARRLPSKAIPTTSTKDMEIIREVYAEHGKVLSTASRLARFFCGVNSPAIFHNRLYSKEHYGALNHLPFAEIFVACKAVISG